MGVSSCEAQAMYTTPLSSSSPGRWLFVCGLNDIIPAEFPAPWPGTCAEIITGPPNFSCPVEMSTACNLWMKVFVLEFLEVATTYNVLELGSMTGVPVIPTSGPIFEELTSLAVTWASFAGSKLIALVDQTDLHEGSSASNA